MWMCVRWKCATAFYYMRWKQHMTNRPIYKPCAYRNRLAGFNGEPSISCQLKQCNLIFCQLKHLTEGAVVFLIKWVHSIEQCSGI